MKTLSVVNAALVLAVAASLAAANAQEPKLPDDHVGAGISQRVDSGLPNAVTTNSHYEYQYGYDRHARWRGHWVVVR